MNAPQVLLYEDDPEAALAQATAALNSGQCIVYPTDTVYGLVGHCESTAAYRRIFELKGRSTDQPLALLVHPAQPAAGAAEGALAGEPALLEQFQSGR